MHVTVTKCVLFHVASCLIKSHEKLKYYSMFWINVHNVSINNVLVQLGYLKFEIFCFLHIHVTVTKLVCFMLVWFDEFT